MARKTLRRSKSKRSVSTLISAKVIDTENSSKYTEVREANFLDAEERLSNPEKFREILGSDNVFSPITVQVSCRSTPNAPNLSLKPSNSKRSLCPSTNVSTYSTNSLKRIKPSKSFTSLLNDSDDILTGNYDDSSTTTESDTNLDEIADTNEIKVSVSDFVHSSVKKVKEEDGIFQSTPNKDTPSSCVLHSPETPPIHHREVFTVKNIPESSTTPSCKPAHNRTMADDSSSQDLALNCNLQEISKNDLRKTEPGNVPIVDEFGSKIKKEIQPNNNTILDNSTSSQISLPNHPTSAEIVERKPHNNTLADESISSQKSNNLDDQDEVQSLIKVFHFNTNINTVAIDSSCSVNDCQNLEGNIGAGIDKTGVSETPPIHFSKLGGIHL